MDTSRCLIGSIDFRCEGYKPFEISIRDYIPRYVGLHENGLYWAGSETQGHGTGIFFRNRKDEDNYGSVLIYESVKYFAVYSIV